MSGECDRCGEHCLDCKCELIEIKTMSEDKVLRDFLLNSASDMSNIPDEPTEISLYDTVEVLSKRNSNWANDEFCQMILAWQASHFLNEHADQVIREKCPHLKELCTEYRELETINGKRLHHLFGMKALAYIMPNFEKPYLKGPFGCAPVQDSYFIIDNTVTPPSSTVTTLKE